MTPEQFEHLMNSQRELYKLNKQLLITQQRIEQKLERLIKDRPIQELNYEKSISEFDNFDWSSIEAKIITQDSDGVSAVEWRGRIYKRRSPENKFAPAIWFSRKEGTDYHKLITFKTIEPAEPISRKVLARISQS